MENVAAALAIIFPPFHDKWDAFQLQQFSTNTSLFVALVLHEQFICPPYIFSYTDWPFGSFHLRNHTFAIRGNYPNITGNLYAYLWMYNFSEVLFFLLSTLFFFWMSIEITCGAFNLLKHIICICVRLGKERVEFVIVTNCGVEILCSNMHS